MTISVKGNFVKKELLMRRLSDSEYREGWIRGCVFVVMKNFTMDIGVKFVRIGNSTFSSPEERRAKRKLNW